MIYKKTIFQTIGEKPLNETSVPDSFKSIVKQVDQKESTQSVSMKKDQNNYFKVELSQKDKELVTLTEKSRLSFNYMENLRFFNVQSL